MLSWSEIKDLVDLAALDDSGVRGSISIKPSAMHLRQMAEQSRRRWLGSSSFEQIEMAPERVLAMRDALVRRLREMAFREAQRGGLP